MNNLSRCNTINSHSLKTEPIVVIGDYQSSLQQLFSSELVQGLKPKILWIDYRVIPLVYFLKMNKKHQSLSNLRNDLFFLEVESIEAFSTLLDSRELFLLPHNGISSVVIGYPPFMFKTHENWNLFRQLANQLTIIILVTEAVFPTNESTIYTAETE